MQQEDCHAVLLFYKLEEKSVQTHVR